MRKLFSILAVALFALSAHATVVTQSIPLSDFSGNATFDGSVITASDNSWPGIYKNDGYSAFALSESHYTELVVELTENPSAGVYVEVTYSDDTNNNISIATSETSGRLVLAGNNVKSVAIKLKAAGSATLSKVYFYKVIGKETVKTISAPEGGHAFSNWVSLYCNQLGDYSALHEGDFLRINYTATASSGWAQCQVKIANTDASLSRTKQDYVYNEQNASGDGVVNLVLSSEDVAALKANGCYLNGQNMTINSVSLVTYAQQIMVETELAHGAEELNWGETWKQIAFPVLTAEDELRVVVSAVNGGNDYQINFKYGWEEGQQIAVTGIDATTPKVYAVRLTAEQASAINTAGQLFMYGTGVTLSRFTVAQPMSIYDDRILCSETHSLDNNWSGGFSIEKEKLSGLKEGNIICLQLTAVSRANEDDQVLLKYGDAWSDFSPSVNYLFQANSAVASEEIPMTVEIPVTAKMRDQLRNQKLNIAGKNYTVTYVLLKEGTQVNTNSKFLNVTSAGMATLVLPFDVQDLPDGVQAYNLTNNGDATIWAEEVFSLTADKPVLIIADAGEYEFVSEEGASDDISSKTATYANGALVGTYTTINPLAQQTGGAYNYILQNGSEGVGFYQVRDNTCSVAPYRAYLSCGYNPPTSVDAPARAMRIVFRENTATGVENTESAKMDGSSKFLRNGQLIILRNGVEYNANGALVK